MFVRATPRGPGDDPRGALFKLARNRVLSNLTGLSGMNSNTSGVSGRTTS